MFNILIVEDDKNLKKLIRLTLQREDYNVFEASDGEEALDVLDKEFIDLIISDVMMPKMDGFELIKELRSSKYQMPILIITAKDSISDKREGFLLGADDYMVKPIDIEELVLRVNVLLKRSKSISEKQIKIGDLHLDYNQMSVIKNDKVYVLTQKEFLLLFKLLSEPNIIYTRQELMEEIWGLESESDFRTVDVHVKRIREKLADIDEFEIVTVRGVGYKSIIHKES